MEKNDRHNRCETKELSILFDISQALHANKELNEVVYPVLKLLTEHMGLLRGTLTIHDQRTDEVVIETAYGLTEEEQLRGRYKSGEGITGKVFQTGLPIIVPKISEEPLFLDRTKARANSVDEEISFICVPIKQDKKVIGTLSVDRLYDRSENLNEDMRLLSTIGSMISRSVQNYQEILEEKKSLILENQRLHDELKEIFHPTHIIGNSSIMQDVYKMISQVAPSETTVLILGESGVGKELVASGIHYRSPRADRPFIKVNCAALPDNLIESELFGHEKGAFTNAVAQRKGRFELADTGTIFLDEIGELSQLMQAKLLRVIQEREFERVGGTQTVKVSVRIIAATNRNLEELIEKGLFRKDLYYRLNVFPIYVPPLRQRRTDICLLADHFIEKYNKKFGKDVKRIATSAIDLLMTYHWPGNVRELENVIERAVLLCNEEVIYSYHFSPTLQTSTSSGTGMKETLDGMLGRIERDMILDALKNSGGIIAKAAEILGLTKRMMGFRVQRYGIDYKKFRD